MSTGDHEILEDRMSCETYTEIMPTVLGGIWGCCINAPLPD